MDYNELPPDWLEQLNHLVEKNLSESFLGNDWLAKKLYMSESTFYRMVVQQTGKSPSQYIRTCRMQKAMELLQSGQHRTVKEVVKEVGFKKHAYFSKLFKEEFGVSPVEVLKNKDIHP